MFPPPGSYSPMNQSVSYPRLDFEINFLYLSSFGDLLSKRKIVMFQVEKFPTGLIANQSLEFRSRGNSGVLAQLSRLHNWMNWRKLLSARSILIYTPVKN